MFASVSKLASEAIGTSDNCSVVPRERILHESIYAPYLIPSEVPYVLFKSTKQEYFFTDRAFLMIRGEAAAGTKRTIQRFEYSDFPITNVHFETAGYGVTDFDCELKFHVAGSFISIDIKKNEIDKAAVVFRTLTDVSAAMSRNAKHYRLAEIALGRNNYYQQGAIDSGLKAEQDFHFIEQMISKYNPDNYGAIFERGLVALQK